MAKPSDRSDEALMAAYVAGDVRAHQELFRRYAPLLLGLMRRGLSRAQDAEDLVQETFLQLHRARHDFRQDAKLRPWLLTIALNLKREYFRRRGRRPEHPMELHGHDEPAHEPRVAEQREVQSHVRRALIELSAAQREVIELHWFAGLSFPEVARVVGASLSAVKVRAHRGYHRLRQVLSNHEVKP